MCFMNIHHMLAIISGPVESIKVIIFLPSTPTPKHTHTLENNPNILGNFRGDADTYYMSSTVPVLCWDAGIDSIPALLSVQP